MKKSNMLKETITPLFINWNKIKGLYHSTFGKGKLEKVLYRNIGGIDIVLALISFPEFEEEGRKQEAHKDYYLCGELDEFLRKRTGVTINVKIGRSVKHRIYGNGVIHSIVRKDGVPLVEVKFSDSIRKFYPCDISAEFFEGEIFPLINCTFKEKFRYDKVKDEDYGYAKLYDLRNHMDGNEGDINLYRILVGGGYRTYNSIKYEFLNENEIYAYYDSSKSIDNYFYDIYLTKKEIKFPDSKYNLVGSTDYMWNNQQRYKDNSSISEDEEDERAWKKEFLNYSRTYDPDYIDYSNDEEYINDSDDEDDLDDAD